ncbi:hypothetical protein HU200_023353 [Digitaria exilis]|uniref:CCHC-type domain-containing protein n=1 Tax=Digitaria exilis TaxID=1010633 RepID=A0A835EWQ5_9POAL|nr:hypothetical protein HU200_023353 [Digitaria exilis]
MITAGCTPDIVVYQRIVHALFAQRNCGEALRVFREIKQRGYDIDRVMYTTMIHGLCKMNRIGDAQQVWDEMVDKGLEPNEYTYCSLVNYYCKAGDFEKARKQTTLTCNIFIKGFCAHERVYEALEVFEEMSVKGIKHDVITYNTLIWGLCKAGMLPQAIRMYEWLPSSGLEPSALTLSPLIATVCKEGQLEAAAKLIMSMRARGLEPSQWSNDNIINVFCKIGRPDEGMAWLAGLLKNNIKPRRQTFDSLVCSLSTSGRVDDALLVLDIMLKHGASDACSKLYVMRRFLYCRMVEGLSVVKQARKIHMLAMDVRHCSKENPYVLPDEFVAGAIISKLPSSWKDFATSLKHKRQEFTIDGLIGALDIEEKARAKDTRGKRVVGASANFVQKNSNGQKNNSHKGKKKPQLPPNHSKAKQTTLDIEEKTKAKDTCGKRVAAASANYVQKNDNDQKNNSHEGENKAQEPPNHSEAKQMIIEEKARAKDTRGKRVVGASANFVQKNSNGQKNNSHKGKKKPQQPPNHSKAKQTTLDIEEKTRAKDTCGKRVAGASANFVQKNDNDLKNNSHEGEKKAQEPPNHSEAKQTILDVEENARAKETRGKKVVGARANFVQKKNNGQKNNSHKGNKKPQQPPNHSKAKKTILDVEENARAKETRGKKVVGASANLVQKNNNDQKNNSQEGKKKPQQLPNHSMAKQTTTFKKKRKGFLCYVCGSQDHFAKKCPDHPSAKSANMVVSEASGTSGYGNYLSIIFFSALSMEWWVDTCANICVC